MKTTRELDVSRLPPTDLEWLSQHTRHKADEIEEMYVGFQVRIMIMVITLVTSASRSSNRRFVITEKAPTRAFSWLKAATTAFTLKTLLRHYAKRALTPRSLNVKLGPRRNYHEGRAAIRHYANQPACPL